jgi:DDE_Tnp_1-associated
MAAPSATLLDAVGQIDDPRKARGVRHPYSSLLALTFLGLLCRPTDLASLQRWAQDHGRTLKGALGFTRQKPPHATTVGRVLARCSLEQFRDVFARGLTTQPQTAAADTAAADGTTSKPGHDAQDDPIPMLNICAHERNFGLAQFPVTGGKPTAPQALKRGLEEWLGHDPFLRLFTADALLTQRPLARVLVEADRNFLFAVKDHQPELLEVIRASFHDAPERAPDAKSVEKQGVNSTPAGSGSWTARRSPPSGRRPLSRASH